MNMETLSRERRTSVYDKNLLLIEKYRSGDKEAGEELTLLNKPLIYSIAQRFTGRGVDMDELCEVGLIGLVKAINTFDFRRECAFSTYAVPLIFGEIRRFLRDDGIIKVSREQKRLSALLNAERERRMSTGESVRICDLAAAVGATPEDAASALFASTPPRSLDEAAFDDEDSGTLAQFISDEDAQHKEFEHLSLKFALEGLSELERKIIILRYFRDFSQCEVARLLGLTQVKISREEKKILARLKKGIEGGS